MALINIGMTQDEVVSVLEPAEPGQYALVFNGFLPNPDKKDQKDAVIWSTKKGGRMVKARFTILSENPKNNGKSIIYNGVIGSFTFAGLCQVLPIINGTEIDTESAIGLEILADVTVETYTNPTTGKTSISNGIDKMYAR